MSHKSKAEHIKSIEHAIDLDIDKVQALVSKGMIQHALLRLELLYAHWDAYLTQVKPLLVPPTQRKPQ